MLIVKSPVGKFVGGADTGVVAFNKVGIRVGLGEGKLVGLPAEGCDEGELLVTDVLEAVGKDVGRLEGYPVGSDDCVEGEGDDGELVGKSED